MDALRTARLEANADPEYGLVSQARLIRERAELLRQRAALAQATATILCRRVEARRRLSRPPAWMEGALEHSIVR